MVPTTWLCSYEMVMYIRNASGNLCACYLYLMMDGAAKIWLKNLPAKSINSWEELK